jgi:hypothetical protein
MTQDIPKIKEHPEKPTNRDGSPLFDNRVHIFNDKTGQLIGYQPYAEHVWGKDENMKRIFERPPNTGNAWNEKNEKIGRWEANPDGSWKKIADHHIETKAIPLNKAEALEMELEALRAENAALKASAEERPKMKKVT